MALELSSFTPKWTISKFKQRQWIIIINKNNDLLTSEILVCELVYYFFINIGKLARYQTTQRNVFWKGT